MRNSGGKAGNRGEPRGNPRREYRTPGKGGGQCGTYRKKGGNPGTAEGKRLRQPPKAKGDGPKKTKTKKGKQPTQHNST